MHNGLVHMHAHTLHFSLSVAQTQTRKPATWELSYTAPAKTITAMEETFELCQKLTRVNTLHQRAPAMHIRHF